MDDTDQVSARVYDLVAQLCPDGPRDVVLPSDRIIDDLGYDSVKVVELVIELELAFDLAPFSEADTAGIENAGDVVALIEKRLAGLAADPPS